jgi:hypothetical protein
VKERGMTGKAAAKREEEGQRTTRREMKHEQELKVSWAKQMHYRRKEMQAQKEGKRVARVC